MSTGVTSNKYARCGRVPTASRGLGPRRLRLCREQTRRPRAVTATRPAQGHAGHRRGRRCPSGRWAQTGGGQTCSACASSGRSALALRSLGLPHDWQRQGASCHPLPCCPGVCLWWGRPVALGRRPAQTLSLPLTSLCRGQPRFSICAGHAASTLGCGLFEGNDGDMCLRCRPGAWHGGWAQGASVPLVALRPFPEGRGPGQPASQPRGGRRRRELGSNLPFLRRRLLPHQVEEGHDQWDGGWGGSSLLLSLQPAAGTYSSRATAKAAERGRVSEEEEGGRPREGRYLHLPIEPPPPPPIPPPAGQRVVKRALQEAGRSTGRWSRACAGSGPCRPHTCSLSPPTRQSSRARSSLEPPPSGLSRRLS